MYIHVYIIFLVIGHFFIFFNILQLNFQPSNNSFFKASGRRRSHLFSFNL